MITEEGLHGCGDKKAIGLCLESYWRLGKPGRVHNRESNCDMQLTAGIRDFFPTASISGFRHPPIVFDQT